MTVPTRQHGPMTILCHAMMVLPAPEMTVAPAEAALVLHSPACHVKSVTMMHVVLNQDTAQSLWEGRKHASVTGTCGQDIHAR